MNASMLEQVHTAEILRDDYARKVADAVLDGVSGVRLDLLAAWYLEYRDEAAELRQRWRDELHAATMPKVGRR